MPMNSGKTILIAGGTGLIGQALVKHLLKHGFEVKILTRNIEKARKIFPDIVAIHKWPKDNEKILFANNKSCEAFVNLSGENIGNSHWTKSNKAKIIESRVQSVNQLNALMQRMPQNPKVWVQASAIGFYGYNTTEPIDELAPVGEGFLASVVNAWERAFYDCEFNNTRKVVLRFGVVMSENGGFLAQMQRAFNWGLAICPGNGKQHISWIHIDDLVEIIYQCIANQKYNGIINAVTPNPLSIFEFTKELKKHTNALMKVRVPAFLFRIIFGKQKANEMVLANQQILPVFLTSNNFKFKYAVFGQIFEKHED